MSQLINESMLNDREFIELKDLKNTLGVSQNTIYRMCNRNELQKIKYRGRCWFNTNNVKSYLQSIGIIKTGDYIKI
jgi:hypothetical protein